MTAGPDGFRRTTLKQGCGIEMPLHHAGWFVRRLDRLPSLTVTLLLLGDDERSGGLRRAPVSRAVPHHGPQSAGHLVGQSDRRHFARPAPQQLQQPARGWLSYSLTWHGGLPPWL